MPNRDRTGPNSKGPMTGRQLGDCSNDTLENAPQFNKEFRRGQRRNNAGRRMRSNRGYGRRNNN